MGPWERHRARHRQLIQGRLVTGWGKVDGDPFKVGIATRKGIGPLQVPASGG
jgi:hypothetical protein